MKRHIVLSDIEPTGYCFGCGIKLCGRGRKYCSEKCRKEYYDHNYSHSFRLRIIRERKQCEKCGSINRLEVHHKTPISKDGELFNDNNVLLLCNKCHKKIHKKGQ